MHWLGQHQAPDLPREVIEHHSAACQSAWPIKHEEWCQAPEKQEIITQEVNKPQDARITREASHPKWIASLTPVARPRGSVRMCVDFIALNQAHPAGPFPPPWIDQTAGSPWFMRMPFSLEGAGATFARLMRMSLESHIARNTEVVNTRPPAHRGPTRDGGGCSGTKHMERPPSP
jgi:hypothetical protein